MSAATVATPASAVVGTVDKKSGGEIEETVSAEEIEFTEKFKESAVDKAPYCVLERRNRTSVPADPKCKFADEADTDGKGV